MSLSTLPQKTKKLLVSWRDFEMLANLISDVVSPPLVGISAAVVFISQTAPEPAQIWRWLALTLPLLCLPPLGYVIWLVRHGELADIHMPDRRSRVKPLTMIMSWAGLCLWGLHYSNAPLELILILGMVLGYIAILSIITLFWKISFHGAAISAAASVGLVPVVGWARIYLRRHTTTQIIVGSLAGMSMGLLLLI